VPRPRRELVLRFEAGEADYGLSLRAHVAQDAREARAGQRKIEGHWWPWLAVEKVRGVPEEPSRDVGGPPHVDFTRGAGRRETEPARPFARGRVVAAARELLEQARPELVRLEGRQLDGVAVRDERRLVFQDDPEPALEESSESSSGVDAKCSTCTSREASARAPSASASP
jgi:hypothetical protein